MAGISSISAAVVQTDFISQLPDEILQRVFSEASPAGQGIVKRVCQKFCKIVDGMASDLTLDYSKAIDGNTVVKYFARTGQDKLTLFASKYMDLTVFLKGLSEQSMSFDTVHVLHVKLSQEPFVDDQNVRMIFEPADRLGLSILIATDAVTELANIFPNLTELTIHGDSSQEIRADVAIALPSLTHLEFAAL